MYRQPFARYSLDTRYDGEPSTRNTVVSDPTKTSAQTSAVAAVRAGGSARRRQGPRAQDAHTAMPSPRRSYPACNGKSCPAIS